MTIDYEYFQESGYLICSPKGKIGYEDVKAYAKTLCRDNSVSEPFMEVVDFARVDEFDFGYFEAEELLALFEALKEQKGYKGSCLVVGDDLAKGMSNIIAAAGRELGIPIKTFKTLEDACKYAEFNVKTYTQ